MKRVAFAVSVWLTYCLVAGVLAADRSEERSFATRSATVAHHGILAAALGLTEPVSAGLGGDLFAMVWDAATGKLYGLNRSGRAPLALTPDNVQAEKDGTIPVHRPCAWTVPGCADAW
jgi:gamma-glutamyltranspeptidase